MSRPLPRPTSPVEADRSHCRHQVYFVGDLIDRGPRSAEVVEFVRHHAIGCVRGNYEQLLIDAMGSDDEVNVFSAQYRVRPYAEAVTPLAPSLVRPRSQGMPSRLSRLSH